VEAFGVLMGWVMSAIALQVTMAMAAILNFVQPPKSCHTLRWIFLQSFKKFDERNPKLF
jgi:hypothetical protein